MTRQKPFHQRRGMAAHMARFGIEASRENTPKALDAIADVVLRYRPKPKSDAAKTRKRKARKAQRESCI